MQWFTKKSNRPHHAVLDGTYGCSYISRNYYVLNTAVRQYVKLFLSIQCRETQERDFLDRQLQIGTFQNDWTKLDRSYLSIFLSSTNEQLAAHKTTRLFRKNTNISYECSDRFWIYPHTWGRKPPELIPTNPPSPPYRTVLKAKVSG